KYAQTTIADSGSGLGSVTLSLLQNATSSPQPSPNAVGGSYALPSPATSPLVITFTKTDQTLLAKFGVTVADSAGNSASCDPVMTSTIRSAGQPQTDQVDGITPAEHLVHLTNGSPGVS